MKKGKSMKKLDWAGKQGGGDVLGLEAFVVIIFCVLRQRCHVRIDGVFLFERHMTVKNKMSNLT